MIVCIIVAVIVGFVFGFISGVLYDTSLLKQYLKKHPIVKL